MPYNWKNEKTGEDSQGGDPVLLPLAACRHAGGGEDWVASLTVFTSLFVFPRPASGVNGLTLT